MFNHMSASSSAFQKKRNGDKTTLPFLYEHSLQANIFASTMQYFDVKSKKVMDL